MSNESKCACAAAPKLIFACSGASDVGEITDRAARQVTREGAGKMYCLNGIGGRVSGIMKTTEAAAGVVVIDGCPVNCAQQVMLQAGFTKFQHVRLAELGMEKGKSPATEGRIAQVGAAVKAALAASDQPSAVASAKSCCG